MTVVFSFLFYYSSQLSNYFGAKQLLQAVAGVLGSFIGYLGAEVSKETIFERLLWPQRFYNHLNLEILVKMGFLMPLGGPLHRAALQTLDTFHERGLYDGSCRKNMVGTAFLRNSRHPYWARTIQHEREMEKCCN